MIDYNHSNLIHLFAFFHISVSYRLYSSAIFLFPIFYTVPGFGSVARGPAEKKIEKKKLGTSYEFIELNALE